MKGTGADYILDELTLIVVVKSCWVLSQGELSLGSIKARSCSIPVVREAIDACLMLTICDLKKCYKQGLKNTQSA